MPDSVDDDIASFPDDVEASLQRATAAVRRAAPDAEETISYGLPTFRLYPKHTVFIGAWKHHVAEMARRPASRSMSHFRRLHRPQQR